MQRCVNAGAPVKRSTVTSDEVISLGNVTLVPGEVYPEQNVHIIEISVADLLTSRLVATFITTFIMVYNDIK